MAGLSASPSSSFAAAPTPTPSFPATLFWGDKLQTLGSVYLVAEALVRSLLMDSEEFADRVAWVVLERMVRDRGGVRRQEAAESRAAVLADIRRQLGEVRSTHAAFHSVADASLVHGAILVLLRVTLLALLSAEFAAAPYAYTLDRHVQELVFLCDFATMVLGKIQLSSAPHHEPMVDTREGMPAMWMPAHYANEALVRALAPLDLMRARCAALTPPLARAASRLLQEHSQALSNAWLSRNLLRLALGYKTVAGAWEAVPTVPTNADGEGGTAEEAGVAAAAATPPGPDQQPLPLSRPCVASVQEILRERSAAIHAWTKRHGIDTSAVFMDPLYRVEAELEHPAQPHA